MPDWRKIKAEYIRGQTSYRKLAEKYGVSFSSLRKIAAKEKWTDLRSRAEAKRDTKIVESVASQQARSVATIQSVADRLLDKIEEGVESGMLVIDSQSIRQITSALKDLRDIKGCKSELDMQEQMARIDKLRKEAQIEENSNEVKVVLTGDLEEWSR